MHFQKGNKGRPPGAKGKNKPLKDAIKEGIDIAQLLIEVDELPLKQRIDMKLKLLTFAYPKPLPKKEPEDQDTKYTIEILQPRDPNLPPLPKDKDTVYIDICSND